MKKFENVVVDYLSNQKVHRRKQTLLRSLSSYSTNWAVCLATTALSFTALAGLLTLPKASAADRFNLASAATIFSTMPSVAPVYVSEKSFAESSDLSVGQVKAQSVAAYIPLPQQVLSNSETDYLDESYNYQFTSISVQSLSALVSEPDQLAQTGAAALAGDFVRSVNRPEIADSTIFTQASPTPTVPAPETIEDLQNQLQTVQESAEFGNVSEGSPALSIANPVGYGADNLTGFIGASYQARTRFSNESDGALGLGIGLGDARKAVGVELAYTFASFGASRDFGTGGFDLKVHHEFAEDFAVAAGWNGFITIGEEFNRDFQDSIYGVATKIFRVRENLDAPFSRAAISIGLGSGQFRTEDDFRNDRSTVNVFGSVAVRVIQPISAIVEWTGQDLALGLSIVPFRTSNFVITPAIRDIVGAGDGARFVLGTGFSFRF